MCMSELLTELIRNGLEVSEARVRWAIKTKKVTRPRVDGSLRFDFGEENVAELVQHFGSDGRETKQEELATA